MRTTIGATLLVLGMAAQPAFARDGAAPTGTAPLLTTAAAAAAPMAVTPMLTGALAAPLASITAEAPKADAAASPFRLGATIAPIAAAERGASALHRRLGTGMIDYYPAGDAGFHLSAGSRLFARRNFIAETEASAHGMLTGAKALLGATTTRAGFKKFNPALTAGYSLAVSRAAKIGVEAGAMMSGAFSNTPGLSRFGVGYRSEHEFRPDAIANMVFGLKF